MRAIADAIQLVGVVVGLLLAIPGLVLCVVLTAVADGIRDGWP